MSFDGLETKEGFLHSLKCWGEPYSDIESKKRWDIVHRLMLDKELPIHAELFLLHCNMTTQEFANWIKKLTPEQFHIYRKESSNTYLELWRMENKSGDTLEEKQKFIDELYEKYRRKELRME